MTYSYNQPVSGVFANVKDEVRFLVRDTVESEFSITDEEIEYLLEDSQDRTYLAASKAAGIIGTNYSKAASVASRSVGDLSISNSYKDSAMEYKQLSQELRYGRATTKTESFFIESDREFSIGQHDQLRP